MTDSTLSVRMGARHSVIGLQESDGSLETLYQFFDGLPPTPGATFVLVLPCGLEAPDTLSEQLAQRTDLPVLIVSGPTLVSANRVYLSPPGRQLVLQRNVLKPVVPEEPESPSVPMVYVLRSTSPTRNGEERGEAASSSYRVVLHASPATSGSESLPLTSVDYEEGHPSLVRMDNQEEPQDSRVERLELKLRETRAELRDMVQKHETAQRCLQETNEKLWSANEALEQRTEQVRSLSEALTLAEETERKRLSHVLHDDLQQVLFAARTKLDVLKRAITLEGREEGLLIRAIEMLDNGIDTTRTMASDLNPPVENSLWETLEWLTIQMQEAHGLAVEMQAQGRDRCTGKKLRVLVVRLVQELLFNVVKHAGTDEARLRLEEGEDVLQIVVEDDGEGFDPQEAINGSGEGFGLGSVRERVELAGGRFSVDSPEGMGARVVLELPFRLEDEGSEQIVSTRWT